MTQEQLRKFRRWFRTYAKSFLTGDDRDDRPVLLKRDHTFRVCDNIRMLGESLGLSGNEMRMAETAALFHDAGRFRQYREHGTFLDSISANHARLGLKELGRHRVLAPLKPEEKRGIAGAVAWHNKALVPSGANGFRRTLALLLRDADKLDIWKVVTEYYHRNGEKRDKTIELNLPDTDAVSPGALASLLRCRLVRTEDIRVLNDFKLLQIGWVYDLNFPATFRALKACGYIEAIAETLPRNGNVRNAVQRALDHLDRNV